MKQTIYFLAILISVVLSCTSNFDNSKPDNISEETAPMVKLYKNIDGQLHYWETWDNDGESATIHWGKVGQKGAQKEIKSGLLTNFKKSVQKEIDRKLKEGYTKLDENKISFLEIEYKIEGFGTEADLDKRHRLEERMDETLGWTGLGHTDGGSIGTGTMEVGCMIVDFDVAKKVIEEDLKNTEFGDYSRIYKIDLK